MEFAETTEGGACWDSDDTKDPIWPVASASSTIANKSLDMPWSCGSESGMLMTLLLVVLSASSPSSMGMDTNGVGVGVDVVDDSDDEGLG